ncbi:uncharacterized protein UHO2_04533 [Ustilago hordei]|uniref:3-methyl-2-oxobutanoate hydroxymethyltransferase n=1 Tax=Ustilago hordei TaxID=120017 RepID=I2FVQ3_USTHO|nr:uncharacterized protein UHO2_04533 [Ustilago hordei]CCF50996.1 related to ECM31-3-methyl-2-oxobutanoate hydroxymethyltransferase [Ustilago hordei]SYW84595.1 related to ECM31 - 3-methyl-2-oxobutanoate hydroxymethyltransferase [Ustilago hordei]
MASTAHVKHMARRGGIISTPSCSYSTLAKALGTRPLSRRTPGQARELSHSRLRSSWWPAGADAVASSSASTVAAKALTSLPSPPRSKTIADLESLKANNTPIVCLTAHDFPTALSIRSSDIDLCLIGDSLANVALGYTSTQPLSLDAIIHHCKAVKRGLDAPLFYAASLLEHVDLPQPPLVIADMPFGATFGSLDNAVAAVVRLIQETGVDGVKIEGSYELVPLIKRLTHHGIPVMGHLGLQPQRVASTSGYRVQGKTAYQAKDMLDASLALQQAGSFSIVLECIPTRVGELISQRLHIPTIGIGAGSKTDGQILVMNDMIGDLTGAAHVLAALAPAPSQPQSQVKTGRQVATMPITSSLTPTPPRFVRNFSQPSTTSIGALRIAAVQAYTQAVRHRSFPDDNSEAYKMNAAECKAFLELAQS